MDAALHLLGTAYRFRTVLFADGPVREARFVRNPDGSADGATDTLPTPVFKTRSGRPLTGGGGNDLLSENRKQTNYLSRIVAALQHGNGLSGLYVPQPNRPIAVAGSQQLAVRAKRHTGHGVRVAF